MDCSRCDLNARSFDQLAYHYRNAHNDEGMFRLVGTCPSCPSSKRKRFANQQSLRDHMKSVHAATTANIQVCCMRCEQKFDAYVQLREHYTAEHHDKYRADGAGYCNMCQMFAKFGDQMPGLEPSRFFHTYFEIKRHIRDTHWGGMSDRAKECWETNAMHWVTGAM